MVSFLFFLISVDTVDLCLHTVSDIELADALKFDHAARSSLRIY